VAQLYARLCKSFDPTASPHSAGFIGENCQVLLQLHTCLNGLQPRLPLYATQSATMCSRTSSLPKYFRGVRNCTPIIVNFPNTREDGACSYSKQSTDISMRLCSLKIIQVQGHSLQVRRLQMLHSTFQMITACAMTDLYEALNEQVCSRLLDAGCTSADAALVILHAQCIDDGLAVNA